MSDCKTAYRKVKEFVQCLYPCELNGNLRRNMNTLAAMITDIIIGKQTQLPQIAANVPEFITLPSTENRFKRLIINENITEQTYFLPFVQSVLINLGLGEMVLAIDGSLVGQFFICLMINLVYKRRALPQAFSVVKGKKSHLLEDTHVELVNKLRVLIPESTKHVVFLYDGEFDGTSLQQTLTDFGRKYVSRTSYNITIYADGEPFQIEILAAILPQSCHKALRNCKITKKKYGPVAAVAWWGDDHDEPLFLVTNFWSASKACEYYSMRFTMETFFSNHKSREFNINKSHLFSPQRLTRLIYASCLAYLWIIFFGILALETGLYKQIHRTDRCDLSLSQLGLRLLNHLAVRGLPILLPKSTNSNNLHRSKLRACSG